MFMTFFTGEKFMFSSSTYKRSVIHKIKVSHKNIGVPVGMPLLVPLNNLIILHISEKKGMLSFLKLNTYVFNANLNYFFLAFLK